VETPGPAAFEPVLRAGPLELAFANAFENPEGRDDSAMAAFLGESFENEAPTAKGEGFEMWADRIMDAFETCCKKHLKRQSAESPQEAPNGDGRHILKRLSAVMRLVRKFSTDFRG
jgi:hypothetical protein